MNKKINERQPAWSSRKRFEKARIGMRSMSKHTEGPWKYCAGGSMVMCRDGQMTIADIRGWGSLEKLGVGIAVETMDANGQLIAAAPELLEACKEALSKLMREPEITSVYWHELTNQLHDAIAKAEGK